MQCTEGLETHTAPASGDSVRSCSLRGDEEGQKADARGDHRPLADRVLREELHEFLVDVVDVSTKPQGKERAGSQKDCVE